MTPWHYSERLQLESASLSRNFVLIDFSRSCFDRWQEIRYGENSIILRISSKVGCPVVNRDEQITYFGIFLPKIIPLFQVKGDVTGISSKPGSATLPPKYLPLIR